MRGPPLGVRADQRLGLRPAGRRSDDVHLFTEYLAERGAAVKWQTMGARSYREAKDVIRQRVRRSLGITAIRAAARFKCDRRVSSRKR